MQTKIRKIIITIIVLCIIGIPIGRHWYNNWYNNQTVEFEDENMRFVMERTSGHQKSGHEASRGELSEIKQLYLGYIGYYDTLEDLKWAINVEDIEINVQPPAYESDPAYKLSQGKLPEEVSKEKVKQYEKELGEILPELKNLEKVAIKSDFGCEWDSIDFLKDCVQIKEIILGRMKVTDYSVLKQCKSLECISIWDSQIEKAEDLDLTGLENLKKIYIWDTPLTDNPEEVKKLQEAYPDVEIWCGESGE